ncbi:uncharacterized protein ACRADG_011457 [Cochliomyia hominivorax]
MQSNQKFMILSLLNLYLKYIDIKRGNKSTLKVCNEIVHQPYHIAPTKESRRSNRVVKNNSKTSSETKNNPNCDNSASSTITERENEYDSIDEIASAIIGNEQDLEDSDMTIPLSEGKKQPNITNNKTLLTRKEKRKANNKNKKQRIRRWGVRPSNRDWALKGFHRKVFSNVKNMDEEQFFVHTRMSKSLFDWLLSFIQSSLKKTRQRIGAEERLVITLNFLAYATPLQSIAFKHKIGKSTVRQIILDTCEALWNSLSPIYLCDLTTSQYVDIANDFKDIFNVPNCVGVIDGKLVSIRVPAKKKHIPDETDCSRMVLIGVCDAKYKFTAISSEIYSNQRHEEIYKLSPYICSIVTNQLPLPSNKPLCPLSSPFPHYFVCNSLLPLRKNVMRPYESTSFDTSKAFFNYKMSRVNSVTENSFGILTARWRVLSTTIEFLPETCKNILLACIALHNYIMTNDDDHLYCPANFIDQEGEDGNIVLGEWRNELIRNGDQPLESLSKNTQRSTYEANSLRDTLANFFVNDTITCENYEDSH